jgi:hypothetical protein
VVRRNQDRLTGRLAEIRPHLDERQWRLLLGAEARAIGRGGVKLVAAAVGASADTVSRGARELAAGIEPRVRRKGAGRTAVEDADPGLVRALEALVDPESREIRNRRCGGRPGSPPSWLVNWHEATARTVARLPRGPVTACKATPSPSGGRGSSTLTVMPSSGTSVRRWWRS